MRTMDPRSLLPSWHRRVVVVSDDGAWAARASAVARDLGARAEIVPWSRAARLRGPVGSLVAHVDAAREGVEAALRRWSKLGWQPLTLVWVPPVRGAADLAALLDRHGFPLCYQGPRAPRPEGQPRGELSRVLFHGGWIVPRFAAALDGPDDPDLVDVLSLAHFSDPTPRTVRAWYRSMGECATYRDLRGLFPGSEEARPKPVLDRLRLAGGAVWAARHRRPPTRAQVARHLGYSSESYLGQRVNELCGLTAGDLVRRPVADVVAALVRPIEASARAVSSAS